MSRVIEVTREIEAPVDEVWRALTEARSLEQWFAVEARVTPPPDRKLWLSWGDGSQGEGQIFHWEPNKHFSWGDEVGGVRMATDYFLEARGANTVVRVVTSGFSDDPAWDDDFHMMEGGWAYFMSHLQTWLERHRGQVRALASSREQSELPKAEAFARLVRALGFADAPTGAGRFAVTTSEGDRLEGSIVALNPGVQLGLQIDNLNHAMLFVEMEGKKERAKPAVWLSTYGLDEAGSSALASRMRRLYERALR
ncbi:MAG: SRPBCC domain-containing protein [Acidobacteriota bacterium]|nr:SRPBCC domain-containing protein [Acidobacteriota bacterium]